MTDRRTDLLRICATALLLCFQPVLAQSQATSDVHPAKPITKPGDEPQSAQSPAKGSAHESQPADQAADADKRESTKAALRAPKASQFRPSGPVTITADHAELVQGNYAVYTGKVTVLSDTLKMTGDRLELTQSKDGQYLAKITGAPAHLTHQGDGTDDPPVTARAQTLNYDSKTETVKLEGDAQLTRGGNIVNGEKISYDLLQQRVQAGGGDNGQVKMVIQPPPPSQNDGAPASPASAAGVRP